MFSRVDCQQAPEKYLERTLDREQNRSMAAEARGASIAVALSKGEGDGEAIVERGKNYKENSMTRVEDRERQEPWLSTLIS
jgi:hypothetical protein